MRILVACMLALPLLLLTGCGDDVTGPFTAGVTLTPDKEVYERGEAVTVTLHNGTVRTIHVWDVDCGWSIERVVNSAWTKHDLFAAPPVCPAVPPRTRPLGPGESVQQIISAEKSQDFLVEGRYRTWVDLADQPFGTREFLGSDSFVVEEAP